MNNLSCLHPVTHLLRLALVLISLGAIMAAATFLFAHQTWAEQSQPQESKPQESGQKESKPQQKSQSQQYQNPSHKDVQQELLRLRSEGIAHFESGIGQKNALALFKKAAALNPESAIEQFNLAVAYKKQNDNEKAKKHLQQAIKLDPEFAHPHYVLGLILVGDSKNQEALTEFAAAAKLMPAEASAHYQVSRMQRELGDNQKALQAIVETLNLDPYHSGAMYQLYLYHQQNGDKEKADQIFVEFSRLKKAVGQTRKEINPDESILARPLPGDFARLKKPFTANHAQPVFSAGNAPKIENIATFAVADVNEDKLQDIISVSREGELRIWLGDAKNNFVMHAKGQAVVGAVQVQAVKLKRGDPHSIIIASAKGVTRVPLINNAAKIQDQPAVHRNIQAEPEAINLTVGAAQSLSKKPVRWLTLADADHDGDTDIILDGFTAVLVNRGDAVFDEAIDYLPPAYLNALNALAGPLLGADLRNLIAVDFVAVDPNGKRRVLRDDMGGKYSIVENALAPRNNLRWSGRADMDNDGWIDILSLTDAGLIIDYNRGNLTFASEAIKADTAAINDAIILDIDNDGYKDIVLAQADGDLRIWNNHGARQFQLSDKKISAPKLTSLHSLDSNSDGLLDIIGLGDSGQLVLLLNKTDSKGANWIKLKLDGIRSAPDGRYTQVEVRYGGFYSKYEADGDIVHIPLGPATHAEVLRISWPNGFVENKFKIDAGKTWFFAESERISGSCPSIYAWNGESYVYITDAFISGPMGVPIAPAHYFPVGDDEYIQISGEHLRADKHGNLRVAIVEELREVTYLDQIRLLAVDYPQDHYLFPNEYLNPPDFPEFKLHLSASAKPPLQVIDHHGQDVADLVRNVDYRYPHNFNRLDYTGFADEQGIELILEKDILHAQHLRLFLTGWFYYFDSTSLMSVAQQPEVQLVWPQIQVRRNGQWEFLKKIGIPPGKEKTVVVELGGQIPVDADGLRLWTNVELYWDRILVDTDAPPAPAIAQTRELIASNSRLRFHGFSELIRPAGDFPLPDRFDYHQVNYHSLWNPLQGRYTRYGEVNELIQQIDSKMAVFSAGDELALTFNARSLPPLKAGYQRDYLLYLNGYVKDGDRYTAHAGAVDPMPFADLPAYPFTDEQRAGAGIDEADYQRYLQEFQSREPLHFTRPGS